VAITADPLSEWMTVGMAPPNPAIRALGTLRLVCSLPRPCGVDGALCRFTSLLLAFARRLLVGDLLSPPSD